MKVFTFSDDMAQFWSNCGYEIGVYKFTHGIKLEMATKGKLIHLPRSFHDFLKESMGLTFEDIKHTIPYSIDDLREDLKQMAAA